MGLDLREIKKKYYWDESLIFALEKALYNICLPNLNISIMNFHFLLLKKKHLRKSEEGKAW